MVKKVRRTPALSLGAHHVPLLTHWTPSVQIHPWERISKSGLGRTGRWLVQFFVPYGTWKWDHLVTLEKIDDNESTFSPAHCHGESHSIVTNLSWDDDPVVGLWKMPLNLSLVACNW